MTKKFYAGLLVAALAFPQAATATEPSQPLPKTDPEKASFQGEPASDETRQVADRVIALNDNRNLPFVIVDKVNAKVFVFDAHGLLRGASNVLLGLARGDDSVPGIGNRKMSSIRPDERTTPAGRFVASLGHDSGDRDILWVDYDDAISLHRVVTTNPKEHRLERLMSTSPMDRRISFGCINVPYKFYDSFIIPAFTGANGIVYVLPETKSIREVFPRLFG